MVDWKGEKVNHNLPIVSNVEQSWFERIWMPLMNLKQRVLANCPCLGTRIMSMTIDISDLFRGMVDAKSEEPKNISYFSWPIKVILDFIIIIIMIKYIRYPHGMQLFLCQTYYPQMTLKTFTWPSSSIQLNEWILFTFSNSTMTSYSRKCRLNYLGFTYLLRLCILDI